jgi:hypothetical protein
MVVLSDVVGDACVTVTDAGARAALEAGATQDVVALLLSDLERGQHDLLLLLAGRHVSFVFFVHRRSKSLLKWEKRLIKAK